MVRRPRHKRKAVSIIELVRMFDCEEKAEQWFIEYRWPDGIKCPKCAGDDIAAVANRKPQPFRCRTCKAYFSVKTGTLLHSSNIPLSKWAVAFYLFLTNLKGISSIRLAEALGISQVSAWYMGHRIRESFDPVAYKFKGPVEVDETFIGGKEKNRRPGKRKKLGRGPVGKAIVVGVKDRATNQVIATVVPSRKREVLHDFIVGRVAAGATVYTDDLRSYQSIPYRHRTVNHSAREYVRGDIHTNSIESHWALFKRGYHGTYHWMSDKHLHRYVAEFAGRHNARYDDVIDQMGAMARGADGKRMTFRELTTGVRIKLRRRTRDRIRADQHKRMRKFLREQSP